MSSYISEITGTIIGIVIGAIMAYLFSRRENKDKIRALLFTEFKNISQELAEVLQDVLYLSLMPDVIPKTKCKEIDRVLSNFAFKYMFILPRPVLEEINCLHVCLMVGGNKTYIVKQQNGLPVLQPRTSDEDIKSLLDEVALVTTKRNLFAIYKNYGRLPNSVLLKCQARHVMVVMKECWKMSDVYNWEKELSTMSIAKIKKTGSL